MNKSILIEQMNNWIKLKILKFLIIRIHGAYCDYSCKVPRMILS